MELNSSLTSSVSHHFAPLDVILICGEKSPTVHDFYCCSLDFFGVDGDRSFATIALNWEKKQLIITKAAESEDSVPFEHAHKCPMRFLPKDSDARSRRTKDVKVRVGICVLVQDKSGKVLISRRAPHLRTCILKFQPNNHFQFLMHG